jgi:hypothetical protein
MAKIPGKHLSNEEREVHSYTTGKAYKLMAEVAQFAQIVGVERDEAASCIGSTFLRLAATIAVNQKAPRCKWIEMCTKVFDSCVAVEEAADERLPK